MAIDLDILIHMEIEHNVSFIMHELHNIVEHLRNLAIENIQDDENEKKSDSYETMLNLMKKRYSAWYSDDAIINAVTLFRTGVRDIRLPDMAISLIDEYGYDFNVSQKEYDRLKRIDSLKEKINER